ncbi:SURF1 family cytochrome oxidase biogenesis protein [Leucobacter chinensis]|uniref:SURF1 family cytochrome oxidase biogenesis protein n=1 Tax=Leucobacter chinensis TaxID=2851010 RepID=UPI00350FB2E8
MTQKMNPELEPAGWSFLTSRRWLGYYALIIAFSIACVLLGNWQFDRRDQARAEINRIDTNYDAAPVMLTEALDDLDAFDIDDNKWQQVTMSGEYLGEPYLARNRAGSDGVGSLLVHPFKLDDGTLFFVDRGWIPVNASEGIPEVLPLPHEGHVEVTVRLRQSETQLENRSNEGRTLGSLDLGELAKEFSEPAYTGAYGQVVSESPAGETGELPTRPERDEGPHLSYALQWYVFILIAICGAWYAATLEHRSLNPETHEQRYAQRKPNPRKETKGSKKPGKLTDAEEEDALLDA